MAGRAARVVFAVLAGLAPCAAQAAPLPPDRPAELGHSQTPSPPAQPPTTPADGIPSSTSPATPDAACLSDLKAAGVSATQASVPSGTDPACHIETAIRLVSVVDPAEPKRSIAFPDTPLLACRTAAALVPWIAQVAGPVLRSRHGAALKAVRTGPGFECRPRNRQAGGKPSAHGLGLAVDIAAFEMEGGRVVSVAAEGASRPPEAAFQALRVSACGWFTTVLGPGSDAFHADHLHLDLQRHGSSDRYRICE